MNIDINNIILTPSVLLCVEILTTNVGLVNNLENPSLENIYTDQMEIGFAWCKPLTRILKTVVVTTTMMVCSVRGSHLPLVIRQ